MADGYRHAKNEFSTKELGLGWLLGVSLLSSAKASAGRTHSHSYVEIIFCLRGEFVYAIQDQKPVTLKTGMGIVVPAHTNHPLRGGVIQPGLRIVMHLSEHPFGGRRSTLSSDDAQALRRNLLAEAKTPFRLGRTLCARLKELESPLRNGSNGVSALELAHFRILCEDIIYRTAQLQVHPTGPNEPRLMETAVSYLDEHYGEKLPIERLVERIGYSRSRFFDLFREHTGLTPHEYLVRLRIRKAEDLLRTSNLPVRKIAQRVGFNDYVHFTSVFKRYTGRTASETRLSGKTT